MKPRKLKISLALTFVGLAVVYLIATAASQTTMYYLTVEEALARGQSAVGRFMRVSGQVVGESVQWDPALFRLSFEVEHNGYTLPAVYYGVKPDNLMDGAVVILEGSLQKEGYFQVERLLVQCTSKYEAADGGSHPGDYQNFRLQTINGDTYEAYESRVPVR